PARGGEMQKVHHGERQVTNRDGSDFRSASPTTAMYRTHPHAQRVAHAFGNLPPRERAVQRGKHRINSRLYNTVGHAFSKSPADPFIRTPCGTTNKDCEIPG